MSGRQPKTNDSQFRNFICMKALLGVIEPQQTNPAIEVGGQVASATDPTNGRSCMHVYIYIPLSYLKWPNSVVADSPA